MNNLPYAGFHTPAADPKNSRKSSFAAKLGAVCLLAAFFCSIASAQTATVVFTGSFTIDSVSVVTQGATGLDFAFVSGGTCARGFLANPASPCTVNYTFTATAPGARYGAIVVSDSTPTVQATTYLTGTGTGPLAVLYPGTQSTIGSGLSLPLNGPAGVVVDASGNVYIADQGNSRVLKAPLADLNCTTPSDCTTIR